MSVITVQARELGARGSRIDVADVAPPAALSDAAGGVLASVPAWWERRAAAAGLGGRWLDVHYALDAEPPPLAAASSGTAVNSAVSAEDLGAAYISALKPQVRARHGRHYTPKALAEQLWTMTRTAFGCSGKPQALGGLVRDPACGAGALLLPALREHLDALGRADPELTVASLPSVIEGVDADPAGVWLANVILAAEVLPLMAAIPDGRRRPIPALARVGDGLVPVSRPVRAVVMNPPYGRVRLDAQERKRFANVVYGHANLYGLFLGAGLETLEEHGVVSALVPTSFTAGRYFANLRAHLADTAPLRRATFVVDRDGVFEDVLQETCLATFTRSRPRHTTVESLNAQLAPVATVKSPRGAGPWLLPRRCEDANVAAAAACMPLTLASAGWRVSTGPLVWNRRRDDLRAHPDDGRVPIVWAADVDGGRLHRDRARDPMRYLTLHSADDRAVMELREPVVLVQRTTATEQPRRIVAVDLTPEAVTAWGGSVVVENHVNVIRARSRSPLLSRSCLARVLATGTMDRLVRCFSGSVALSAYELEALPLPDADTLASLEPLAGAELETAVAAAYRPEDR